VRVSEGTQVEPTDVEGGVLHLGVDECTDLKKQGSALILKPGAGIAVDA
jgi:hypothetical protein